MDNFLKSEKTFAGFGKWEISRASVNEYKFQRFITQDGIVSGAYMEANAYVRTSNPPEFRYLLVFEGYCAFRIDCAPTIDPNHINGPVRPFGYPFAVYGNHIHDWRGNRERCSKSKIDANLPYAIESKAKMITISQGFWVFCDMIGISATKADDPEWPKADRFL